MYKTNPLLIEKCRSLRVKGFTLNEIIEATQLPKITIYDHIQDVLLSPEAKERIGLRKKATIQKLVEFSRKKKGKCLFGRKVIKPKGWSKNLVLLAAHFLFDGTITSHDCDYQNRNLILINRVKTLVQNIFHLNPIYRFYRETGVHRISYFYVELANYFQKKSGQLKEYIINASSEEKKLFLKAFFDDEGCVYYWRNARKIRGYQHNLEILKLIQKLLKDFNIESKIDKQYKEIVISRKPNLIKFRNKINFSKGIYINPDRKNSIWKKKLEKRKILDYIISLYKK